MSSVEVHLDLPTGPILVGMADVATARGVTTCRFSYDRSYLAGPGWDLGPDLPVTDGETIVEGLPGALADSAPDAWGRNLITRHLARRWAGHGTPPASELDYLLGVSDATRQGALRFSLGGGFLAEAGGVPPTVELPRLLAAATQVARGDAHADDAVDVLLDVGSGSLGGARPKASVLAAGGLAIAKFPHPDDRWDVIRWEAVALDLAERCGLPVPGRRVVVIGTAPVLIVDRFDRVGHDRVPYLSARSLVGPGTAQDYLEVAEAIADHGSAVQADLQGLWRRLAFSIAINNIDDHLRNLGLLRATGGWKLAPVFDVNPDPTVSARRATSVGGETAALGCQRMLFDAAEAFSLERTDAEQQWSEVCGAVAAWREIARTHGLGDEEIDRFAPVLDRWRTGP